MTLPNQAGAAEAVLDGQEFLRIRRPITGPGDIFEIDDSTRSIYIGPNSDIAEVRLSYFDQQAGTNQVQVADVSVGGPFVGRLDSLLSTQYPGIDQPARILAYPVDIVDPTYQREAPAENQPLRRFNIPAEIDLICAVKALPEVPAVRADRTFRFPRVPFNNDQGAFDDGSTDIVIPIYGRRMITTQIITPVGIDHVTSFYLAVLQPGQNAFAKFLGQVAVSNGTFVDTTTVVFRASDQYNMDEITWTDGVGPATMTNYPPLPKSKGMADLLIINIAPDFDPPPPAGYSLVDFFIKLSDRED